MGVCACNKEQERRNVINGNSFSKHELVLCFMVYNLFSTVTGSPERWNVLKLISVSETNPDTYHIHLQLVIQYGWYGPALWAFHDLKFLIFWFCMPASKIFMIKDGRTGAKTSMRKTLKPMRKTSNAGLGGDWGLELEARRQEQPTRHIEKQFSGITNTW